MQDEQAVELIQAIRRHAGLELDTIRDAGTHGADAGFGGFTYYGDTSDFYNTNKSLLWEIMASDAEDFGFDSVPAFVASFNRSDMAEDQTGFECLVAWYALESAGHWLNDRRDARVCG